MKKKIKDLPLEECLKWLYGKNFLENKHRTYEDYLEDVIEEDEKEN